MNGELPFIDITKVSGGFSGGGTGNASLGSGVAVKEQELTIGQRGKPYKKVYRVQSQSYTKSKSSRLWTQAAPSSWLPVQSNTAKVLVGANLYVKLGRGNSTWSVTVDNNIIDTM